ncbi:MAG: hypothetical protein CMI52_01285 [Parcubacteria group bacterium]|nr:hypothetical protein [Parcubacteria group bacterium]|tara:strand:+ start:516 stop:1778 length:1263 start_codon:yes stop_codon:yes gene_type:complete
MRNLLSTISHKLTILGFFLLPWQTIWIYKQVVVNDHVWQYATLGFYLSELVLWVALMLWMIVSWKHKKISFRNINQIGPIFFAAMILLTLKASGDISITIQGLTWAVLSWWVALVIIHAKERNTYLTSFAISLIVAAILGFIQFIEQSVNASALLGIAAQVPETLGVPVVVAEGQRLLRTFGSFPHPNIFGGYMVLGIILSLRFIQSQKKMWFGRTLFVASLVGLLISFSRSAWLAAFFLLVYHIFISKRWKKTQHMSSIAVAIIAIFVLTYHPYILNRIQPSNHIEEQSISQRAAGYEDAKKLSMISPAFGVGFHNYTQALQENNSNLKGYELQPVHNVPLLIVVEWGILGLLALLLALWYLIKSSPHKKNLLVSLFILLPILMLDHYVYTLYAGIMLIGLIVALNVHLQGEQKNSSHH